MLAEANGRGHHEPTLALEMSLGEESAKLGADIWLQGREWDEYG
jgi:hypothetical protein